MPDRPGLWRNRNFLVLFFGQWVSRMGDRFFTMAVFWFVFNATHSRFDLGVVGTVGSAAALFGLVSGTLVDRWDHRRTMMAADGLRALIALGLGVLALAGHMGVATLIGLVACLRLVGTVFTPAEVALLPQVVPADDLPAANGANQSAQSTAQLAGAAAGGALLALVGPTVLFFANGLSFAVSVLTLGWLRLGPRWQRAAPGGTGRVRGFLRDLLAGHRLIWHHVFLRRLVFVGVVVNFAMMPLEVLDLAWVREELHQGSVAYALFGMAIIAGLIASGLVAGRLASRVPLVTLLTLGLSSMGLFIGVLSRIPLLVPDLLMLVGLGFSAGVVNAPLLTLAQRIIPPALMGRVVGTMQALMGASTPLGALVAGALASALPLGTVFLGAGVLALLGGGLLLGVPSSALEASSVTG